MSWLSGDRRRTGGSGPATDDAAASGPHSGRGSAATGAWRELPPLQRTTGDAGLLADPAGFRSGLDTWQDVSLTGRLGHLVGPDAPAGVLYGVAVPVTPPAETAAETGGPSTAGSPPLGGTGTVRPPAPAGGSVPLAVGQELGGTGSVRPAVPLQRAAADWQLTVAAPLASPPTRHLTGFPADPAPEPAAAPDAVDVPTVRDLPAPPLTPSVPLAPPTSTVQRSVTAPDPVPRPHPQGVGEPLTGLPPTAQREPAARSVPAPVRPGDPASTGRPEQGTSAPAEPVPVAPEPRTGPLLADDPLVPASQAPDSQAEDSDPASVPAPPASSTGAPGLPVVGLQRLPVTAAGPVAADSVSTAEPTSPEYTMPLTGERPLPLYSGVDGTAPADPEPVVVPARWSAPAAPTSPEAPNRPAPTVSTGARVQRTVEPSAPSAFEPVAARQPSQGPSPAVRAGLNSSPPDAGSAAVAFGIAQRMADGSVVFPNRSRTAAVPRLPVQRAADSAPDPPPADPLPDVPVPVPLPDPPLPASTTTTTGPPATGTSAPAPPGSAATAPDGGPPQVTDDLVRALFPRLSRLLKDELRRDRERAGLLINTRH
ncbi:hypothetical protein ITX44_19475 [Streptomyces sp. KK5PA1]|uniref:Syndecan 1 n=1 Tax=Actinacidiphila acididurans TaxID=2784346 RepID=A0ABS2TTN8_9ACTN|nr:hypothetical protein [Actinacidiphila acididurans]